MFKLYSIFLSLYRQTTGVVYCKANV